MKSHTDLKIKRSYNQIIDDRLWPGHGISPDPMASVRHQAIYAVLSVLPDDSYSKLVEMVDGFHWFIPRYELLGQVFPFVADYQPPSEGSMKYADVARVLYLSPSLEKTSFRITMAVIAHELAHLVLGHKVYTSGEEYPKQESEAWELVDKWGFEKEAKLHEAQSKRRDTLQRKSIEKIRVRAKKS